MKRMNERIVYAAVLTLLSIALLSACAPVQTPSNASNSTSAQESAQPDAGSAELDGGKLNINTATPEDLLAAIPGLGEKMVDEFQEYRPFRTRAQFRQEIGKYVDEAQLDDYEQYVFVPLNVNEASTEDFLATVPGLGEKMAGEFEEYRPFVSIVQFREEMGKYVDEAQIAEYEQYIYVPVDVNESDAATLQATLGVPESVAAELVAARPYASNADFLTALSEQMPDVDPSVAEGHLVEK